MAKQQHRLATSYSLFRFVVFGRWHDEDTILELADHLPGEAAEARLDLAVGATPKKPEPVDEGIDPFHHPDAQRRFRVMNNVEELAQVLDYPWEKWAVFLHPAQRQLVYFGSTASTSLTQ